MPNVMAKTIQDAFASVTPHDKKSKQHRNITDAITFHLAIYIYTSISIYIYIFMHHNVSFFQHHAALRHTHTLIYTAPSTYHGSTSAVSLFRGFFIFFIKYCILWDE